MKKLLIILLFLVVGCGSTKKVKTKEDIKIFEKGSIKEKAFGDRIFWERPRVPNQRPKSQTVINTGDRGAELRNTFDEKGDLVSSDCDCPEIDVKKEWDNQWKYKFERMDLYREGFKVAQSTILWCFGMYMFVVLVRFLLKDII